MVESLITMSIVGLLAGFLFSMPVAGPISILITSNALKGRIQYCNKVALGASIADFIYVFISVYGITRLYPMLKPAMPYILAVGSLFILFIGYRVFRSKVDLVHADEIHPKTGKLIPRGTGGFYTGFMINFLNPTLLFGSFTTTVLVISFVSSLGFNTGGLNAIVGDNVLNMNGIGNGIAEGHNLESYLKADTLKFFKNHADPEPSVRPAWFSLVISISYSLFLALGSILWFLVMAMVLSRLRKHFNLDFINVVIKGLGLILCLFGFFFAYTAVRMFMQIGFAAPG